jgi:hypothetical protein
MKRFLFAMTIVVCGAVVAEAGPSSFFSTRGLGLRRFYPNARTLALGGMGIALDDWQALSALNPALQSRITLTRLSVSFLHETSGVSLDVQNGRVTDSNVAGAQFFIPLGRGLGISAGIRPYTAVEYSFTNEGEVAGANFVEKLSGDGGVNSAFLTFSVGVGRFLQLGLRGNAYFGRIKRVWEVNYASAEFRSTKDQIVSFARGYGFTLGAVVSPIRSWRIGAVVTPGFDLTAEIDLDSRSGIELPTQKSTYNVPIEYGAGTTFNLSNRFLVGVDVLGQRWSEFGRDSGKLAGWEDALRIGGGIELTGRLEREAGFFSRLSYRLGAYQWRLGVQAPDGQEVIEKFATFGLGIPFNGNWGRIDVAVQVGRRGKRPDNPVEETVWRVAVGISGGERWFMQRR